MVESGGLDHKVDLRSGDGKVLFAGTSSEFKAGCETVARKVRGHIRAKREGRMPKDDSKMKETEGDIHVRERSYRVSAGELAQFVERIESLAVDKAEIQQAIKEVYAEAKERGYNTKCIRKLIAERKRDASDVDEEQVVMDLYRRALGR